MSAYCPDGHPWESDQQWCSQVSSSRSSSWTTLTGRVLLSYQLHKTFEPTCAFKQTFGTQTSYYQYVYGSSSVFITNMLGTWFKKPYLFMLTWNPNFWIYALKHLEMPCQSHTMSRSRLRGFGRSYGSSLRCTISALLTCLCFWKYGSRWSRRRSQEQTDASNPLV